jgi:FKBP-type peptidyl-prolyl cis-trans isomerase
MRSKHQGIVGGLLRILPVGVVGWALIGCDSPPDIVPLAPPGMPVQRKNPDADPAQAQGEVAAAPAKGATPATKTPEPVLVPAPPTAKGETKTLPGGVKYETLKDGTGPELKLGQTGEFIYEGRLESGKVFDASTLRTNLDGMINGWKEGLPGMKVGEVRQLTIPPEKGYGAAGRVPQIPPNATLIFKVELAKIHGE